MDHYFDKPLQEAIRVYGDLIPHKTLESAFMLLSSDPTEEPHNAVVQIVGHRYHVSTLKLFSGLAALGRSLQDPPSLILEAFTVVAAIATISSSVRKVTIDEAAICQALHEARRPPAQGRLTRAQLAEKLVELTQQAENVQARCDSALASLDNLHVIERDDSTGTVSLADIIIIRR